LLDGAEGEQMSLNKERTTQHLRAADFRSLFIEELGWDNPTSRQEEVISAGEQEFQLAPVADKRGVRIFRCENIPERTIRQRIEKEITKLAFEHLIIFMDAENSKQIWQWVAREKGKPDAFREHSWLTDNVPDPLIQKLDHIAFSLDEEEALTLAGTTLRMRDAFDREKITKKFYDAFKKQHDHFLSFIKGLTDTADQQLYASLMLNRLMFVYFIQKKGFLDGDIHYLKNRLATVRETQGEGKFHNFYRAFLLKLFHSGLATPKDQRDADTTQLIGTIPYLNGGLFEPHVLEAEDATIQIADEAFEAVFNFFDQYEWTLDTRAIERADGREINPDVLGHIFEKYINQKQMGAYYTKEDITDYITKNTVIPWLFQTAMALDKVAFEQDGFVWRMLKENPDTYIFKSVSKGVDAPLPEEIEAGISDVSKRGDWNKSCVPGFGLPTETWRESIARRQRYQEVKSKIEAGEITEIEDLITFNLDIRQFAQDIIQYAESPDVVRAFWKGISTIKILDPACGSGAFLFAALGILFDLYDACLERMDQFVSNAPQEEGGRAPLYSDFREVLEQVASHPNRAYYIYKTIVISNLYGVDIMDEAVEICKLRLFLKLAAQLERSEQIEPLPDIDFNIRSGNSLIGYTSFVDIKRATEASGFDFDDRAEKIEAAAQDLDKAFELFRKQQIVLNSTFEAEHKLDLRRRLSTLGDQLDHFLAKDYGVDIGDSIAFDQWKQSHKPFHWLIEFFGIVEDGGFHAIVGNPPYVELSKVKKDYEARGYSSSTGGNLYGLFIEHAYRIANEGSKIGLIVPISVMCTNRTRDVQSILLKSSQKWISTFDVFPARIFEGAAQRVSIIICSRNNYSAHKLFTTRYMRWLQSERNTLIEQISYVDVEGLGEIGWFPRLGSEIEKRILAKLDGTKLDGQVNKIGTEIIYAHRIVNNFVKAVKFAPFFKKADGTITTSDDFKKVRVNKDQADALVSLLNSSLFFWYWRAHGDGFHCGYRDIGFFPLSIDNISDAIKSQLSELAERLSSSLDDNSEIRTRDQKSTGLIHLQTFFVGKSKSIIDEIDYALSSHYGFNKDEIDFLVNIDIKYRMALDD
jgi:hypothetical protein